MRPPPARALRPSPRYRAASRWRRAGRGAGSRARDRRAGAPQRRAGARPPAGSSERAPYAAPPARPGAAPAAAPPGSAPARPAPPAPRLPRRRRGWRRGRAAGTGRARGGPRGGPAVGRGSPAGGPGVLSDPREGAGRDRRRTGAGRKRRMMHTRPGAGLAEAAAALRREPLVAADTEAASFHRYRDRIFLVQLSSPRQTAIIDPLAVRDLAPLGDLLADPQVEKIFHDADYDLRILDRDYGFRARRLCDTRIAAQLAGERAVGLAALLDKYLGVKLSKEHQKADWSRRPLPAAMLEYAAADTRHLPALREALQARPL